MIFTYFSRLLCVSLMVLLVACNGSSTFAPVSEVRWHPYARFANSHTVRRGETLYAIAFRYDTDYRRLAQLNHLSPPYRLRVGQVLRVRGAGRVYYKSKPTAYKRRVVTVKPKAARRIFYTPKFNFFSNSSGWTWPARGRVVTGFVPDQGKKGINIACSKGEKVHAASSGVVAYAGSGLSGYGNLIIIKHNNEYLTAYGNNSRNMVSEGQRVRSGQVIAEVGLVGHKYYGVHFEIRRAGKPVNPLNYLRKG